MRRFVTVLALLAMSFSVPALAASSKKSSSKKPAATSTKKKAPAKAVATPTPAPVVETASASGRHKADPDGRTFIRTQRAGWQEVVVGDKVEATRVDGSKVKGTIKEVSDFAIVIEPKAHQKVEIASGDLNQVFRAH